MSEDEKILISVQWLRMWKSFHADESSKQKHKIELSKLFAAKAHGVKNCEKLVLSIGGRRHFRSQENRSDSLKNSLTINICPT